VRECLPAEAQDVRRPLRRSPKGARLDAERDRQTITSHLLERVCLKTRFGGFRPGETRVARFPHQSSNNQLSFNAGDYIKIHPDQLKVRARKYWNKLQGRFKAKGSRTVTICNQLKLVMVFAAR